MKNKKGFTLVELLVVIAIIGILSTVAIVNLNSARDKARAASVQAALTQLTSAAILCQDDDQELTTDGTEACSAEATDIPTEGGAVCDAAYTDATWPDLDSTWTYKTACNSSVNAQTWAFGACEGAAGVCTSGGRTVDCTQTGCTSGITP